MNNLFYGGIHPFDGKELTRYSPVKILPPPERLIVPFQMHIGAQAKPQVSPGEEVRLGQILGEINGAVSSYVHSPVSGKVAAVEERLHPNGRMELSVVIDNDGLDTPHESVCPTELPDPSDAGYSAAVVEVMRNAGIVGMGGAAFPGHFKLQSGIGKADTLIINAAECEPYITSDHRTLLEVPDEVLFGVRTLTRALRLDSAIIAIEENKDDAIKVLEAELRGASDIKLRVLPTRYPQGAEKQLIQSVTGRLVPPGKLPADVGCVVFNVYTAWSVWRAVCRGIPVIERVVTVSGPAVESPKNLLARMGTPVRNAIEEAGGLKAGVRKVLLGGPMMGNAIYNLDVPVIKGTNAIIALFPYQTREKDDNKCIHCGRCVSVCPMRLQPLYMYQNERADNLDALRRLNLNDCMECGSCTYICPGRVNLVQAFRSGKAKLRAATQ
ncbi:MAG: electron transport complex subunit RsxC [Oscillospiraceae bacterium]|nr:electron transport complex subunit RsxC [Oscillospiraceae bacterium]